MGIHAARRAPPAAVLPSPYRVLSGENISLLSAFKRLIGKSAPGRRTRDSGVNSDINVPLNRDFRGSSCQTRRSVHIWNA